MTLGAPTRSDAKSFSCYKVSVSASLLNSCAQLTNSHLPLYMSLIAEHPSSSSTPHTLHPPQPSILTPQQSLATTEQSPAKLSLDTSSQVENNVTKQSNNSATQNVILQLSQLQDMIKCTKTTCICCDNSAIKLEIKSQNYI